MRTVRNSSRLGEGGSTLVFILSDKNQRKTSLSLSVFKPLV